MHEAVDLWRQSEPLYSKPLNIVVENKNDVKSQVDKNVRSICMLHIRIPQNKSTN